MSTRKTKPSTVIASSALIRRWPSLIKNSWLSSERLTEGVKRSLDNQEFFIKLGQRLIKALDAITVDGFVFRVDMRLRPYGSAGSLVFSFNALEQYYQDQGRDWERYAMIKARVVAGDQQAGKRLLEMLMPFVYRRYLDFSAIEALRAMKQLIQQEEIGRAS